MIDEWKNLRKTKFHRQKKFLKSLSKKRGNDLDTKAEKLHKKVFSKLDCLSCANCCKSIPPIVNRTDTKRIAKHLNLSISTFSEKYLRIDEDGDSVINRSPCPFLESDNACSIYDVRPRACRAYPHTDHYEFSLHLNLHIQNLDICPAVYHIVERLRSVV